MLTRILSARLKKLLFLGGLHSPCDNYSFLANVYCLRTKERRVLTGQLLLSAVKSCWNQLCLNARWCRRLYSQMCFLPSNIARYLVDPASSHMLVSKIKPCMSKYKRLVLWNCEWLIKSVMVYLMVPYYLDNRSNSRANTCRNSRLRKGCIY